MADYSASIGSVIGVYGHSPLVLIRQLNELLNSAVDRERSAIRAEIEARGPQLVCRQCKAELAAVEAEVAALRPTPVVPTLHTDDPVEVKKVEKRTKRAYRKRNPAVWDRRKNPDTDRWGRPLPPRG